MFCGDIQVLADVVVGLGDGFRCSYIDHWAIPELVCAGIVRTQNANVPAGMHAGNLYCKTTAVPELTEFGRVVYGLLKLNFAERGLAIVFAKMLSESRVDVAGIHGCDEVA